MTTTTNPATSDDLEDRFYRELTAKERLSAQTWLDDAWNMLLDRRPALPDDIAAATVREATVIRVVVGMVMRVFKNPEALTKESLDDYALERAAAISAGELYVSPADLADVTPGRKSQRSVRLIAYGQTTALS